jgi:hypothetical protein
MAAVRMPRRIVWSVRDGTGDWSEIFNGAAVEFTDSGLVPETIYYYRARSIWGALYSEYSAVVSATTFPAAEAVTESEASLWIDIEDQNTGDKLGYGPLRSATGWSFTPALDGAGTFRFQLPAADPQCALLEEKRIAHAWGVMRGTLTDFGRGIIDQVQLSTSASEVNMLDVSAATRWGAGLSRWGGWTVPGRGPCPLVLTITIIRPSR